MDNLQQMREAFQKTYGGLGLMSEIEAALIGAWCLAWTAGAEAAQEDAIGLACVTGIVNDMTAETQDDFRDNFLRSWVDLVDRKGYWTESDAEWKSLPEFSDLAAQTHDGLPCIVRLTRGGYLRSVSYPDGTTIPANEPFPPEKTCYRWFVPDCGQFKDCWIPVSRRLPEYNKPVLVKAATVPRREASLKGSVNGECFVGSLTEGGWELPSPGNDGQVWTWGTSLVTHWKPL